MRLFLAIEPDENVRGQVGELIDTLRSQTPGVRWTPREKLHLTLAFFGDVHESRVAELTARAAEVVYRHRAFDVTLAGAGVFPGWRKPRVVWLGIQDAGALESLARDVAHFSDDLGFPRDHPFAAHLTIGRISKPLPAGVQNTLKKALLSWDAQHPFEVSRVILMQSALRPSGSEYILLAAFPLGAT
jgi:2'-5' RNA ligase